MRLTGSNDLVAPPHAPAAAALIEIGGRPRDTGADRSSDDAVAAHAGHWTGARSAVPCRPSSRIRTPRMHARSLFLLVFALGLAACGGGTPVSDGIRSRIVDGATIRIAEITTFGWDTLHVFSPYTPNTAVCSKLGETLRDCAKRVPATVDEGGYLLAFSRDGRVVHLERYGRGTADFCEAGCAMELTKRQAVFRVDRIETPAGPWRRLILAGSHA